MQTTLQTIRKDEQGFTLVELAVVMIIIGLLIGGILKGQELITNARVTSTIGEMEGIAAAYNDFRNQFNALPGDMSTAAGAAGRIQNCASFAACNNGDGDGIIDVAVGGAPGAAAAGAANEPILFFGQLLAAGYISSMDGTGTVAFGNALPATSLEGGFTVGDTRTNTNNFTATEFRPGVYLVHNGSAAAVGATTGSITGQQAANIDRRLDDGAPNTGSVLGQSNGVGTCRQAVAVYNQAAANSACAIAYRL